jgi:cell shape-determining protein MreD
MNNTQKRELTVAKKKGIAIQDLILVGVLLAAGAVLKYFVGSIVNFGGMKPNFLIAMYCLAIMLIRPNIYEGAVIGLLAGAICQFFPGTPYLNFISELAGAAAMTLIIKLPLKIGNLDMSPGFSTLISTIVSGGLFVTCLFLVLGTAAATYAVYVPIVLGTALINTVIVQLLYIPMKLALKRD